HGVELFLRLVGVVGLALGDQLLGHLAVPVDALGLVDRAFVVVQAQPVHGLEDGVDRRLGAALAVGVLDPQHEPAAAMAGLQPAVQRGAGATDVQVAGGTGGEAGAAGHGNGGRQGMGHFTPPAPWPCPAPSRRRRTALPRCARPDRAPYGPSANTTRLRPARLASYSASSARLNSASKPSSGPRRATPKLTVTGTGTPCSNGCLSTARRRSSAIPATWSVRTPGSRTTNSSPPQRTSQSPGRSWRRSTAASSCSTRSPVSWPQLSLTRLKWSMSSTSRAWAWPGATLEPAGSRAQRCSKPWRLRVRVSGSVVARVR